MITAMDILRAGRREEYLAMHEKGLKEGLRRGVQAGMKKGRKEGRQEGRHEGRQEGREEGRQVGREEGFELGLAEGIIEGERQALLRIIELRFGRIQRSLWARIERAARDDRAKLIRALATAERPEQLVPARKRRSR